jgi:inner membrane transporter RhtA
VQFGAAVAATLFARVGSASVVLMRQGFAAVVLIGLTRTRWRALPAEARRLVVQLGVVFSFMNLSFYASVQRLPLGVAVTIELLGPLGLATALSRRVRELALVALAGAGVVVLGWSTHGLSVSGVVFALVAALGWVAYIHLSSRNGARAEGAGVLGWSLGVAAVLTAPVALLTTTHLLLSPKVLAIGAMVGVLSAVVPFTLELSALRRIERRPFGVLMSMSPVVAALMGRLVLGESLRAGQYLGIIGVVAACGLTAASS